jgi:hypothetical protein
MRLETKSFLIMVKPFDDQLLAFSRSKVVFKFFNDSRQWQHQSTALFPGPAMIGRVLPFH